MKILDVLTRTAPAPLTSLTSSPASSAVITPAAPTSGNPVHNTRFTRPASSAASCSSASGRYTFNGAVCPAFRLNAPIAPSGASPTTFNRRVTVRSDSPDNGASRDSRLGFSNFTITSAPAAFPPNPSAAASDRFTTTPPSAGNHPRSTPNPQNSRGTPYRFTPAARCRPSGSVTVACNNNTGTAVPAVRNLPASPSPKNPSCEITTLSVPPNRNSACRASVARTESPVTNDPLITAAVNATPRNNPACHRQ